ncbi:hypothetical protein [uncultured Parasphingopyxis sp.]|uniref:hypothetical protein n=1 Tax=uncultured Parasphingopyxis sp. TaxID=1547918 RepID=UPI00261C6B14|nr:hypothetical protein [uncultured Parasphingopyxis sp.]
MSAPRAAMGWGGLWRQVVADALWLAGSGYAAQALALGWKPLHLFGAVDDPMSDARPGLAVWLNGSRKLVLLDDAALAPQGDIRRVFNVRPPAGAVLLWELGQ